MAPRVSIFYCLCKIHCVYTSNTVDVPTLRVVFFTANIMEYMHVGIKHLQHSFYVKSPVTCPISTYEMDKWRPRSKCWIISLAFSFRSPGWKGVYIHVEGNLKYGEELWYQSHPAHQRLWGKHTLWPEAKYVCTQCSRRVPITICWRLPSARTCVMYSITWYDIMKISVYWWGIFTIVIGL